MEITEQNFIKELRRKNPKALEYIINLYGNDVYALVYNIMQGLGSKEDFEECASEVFTVVWNKCDSYSDERGSFRTWVLILSKYKALDYRRRLSRHNKNISTENIELESSDSVENSIITKDENSRIMQAIKCLKEIDREIFYRRYFFYESIESIANRLGLTRENIDNRLCRGRKKIREILFDYGKGEVV